MATHVPQRESGQEYGEENVEPKRNTLTPRHLPNASGEDLRGSQPRHGAKRKYDKDTISGFARITSADTPRYREQTSSLGATSGSGYSISTRPEQPLTPRNLNPLIVQAGTAPAPFQSSLSKLSHGFALVRNRDFSGILDYVVDNPDVLKESDKEFLKDATRALKAGKVQYAESCVEKAVVISECKRRSKGKSQFLNDLVKVSQTREEFEETYLEAFRSVQRLVDPNIGNESVSTDSQNRHEAQRQAPQLGATQLPHLSNTFVRTIAEETVAGPPVATGTTTSRHGRAVSQTSAISPPSPSLYRDFVPGRAATGEIFGALQADKSTDRHEQQPHTDQSFYERPSVVRTATVDPFVVPHTSTSIAGYSQEQHSFQYSYQNNFPIRTKTSNSATIPQIGTNTDRHVQGQSVTVSGARANRLSEPLLSFSRIEPGDFRSCKEFIRDNSNVLDENKNLLLLEAIHAQKEGNTLHVRACIQRAIIIQECKEFSLKGAREYLDDLINKEDEAATDFYELFDQAHANILERAGVRRPAPVQEPVPPLPPPPTMGTLPSISESQIEYRGTKGEVEKLDKRYRKRGDPAQFFAVGRVFALLWHENVGSDRKSKYGSPKYTSKSKYDENIFSHIRRMVVVRQRIGYCWCIGINSYGGRGVAKDHMSKEEVESHTIIHMSTEPAWSSATEREMNKEPIAVDTANGQKLDKWSRLNFAKIHTVEHSVKVMDVGFVSRADMPKLEGYWRNEMVGNTS